VSPTGLGSVNSLTVQLRTVRTAVRRQKDRVMSEKKWFEISGYVDCQFRLAIQAIDEAEAKELFGDTTIDFVDYIDWIDDYTVISITPYDGKSPVKVLTPFDSKIPAKILAGLSRDTIARSENANS
jgi:hypothetical protein